MKDRNCRQRNKQKGHQSIWGNWRERKIKQSDVERGSEWQKKKATVEIYMPWGKSAVFQAQCLCAILITAGFSCPRLFDIKLRQLLDFPFYCHGIGLLQCPSMFFSSSSASTLREPLSQVAGHLSPPRSLLWGRWPVLSNEWRAACRTERRKQRSAWGCPPKGWRPKSIVGVVPRSHWNNGTAILAGLDAASLFWSLRSGVFIILSIPLTSKRVG